MVPWLKPTSASADGGSLWRLSSASRNRSSSGAALLTPTQRSFGSRKVSANHCRPTGACAARLRRVRRDERRLRQVLLPGAADVDEIVAVGAVAVQEHDKLLRARRSAVESRGPSSSAAIAPL